MAQIAQGTFSVRKLIDGKTLTFNLSSNRGYNQIKSKDPISYNPDYTTSNLIMTPTLCVSGNGGVNQIKSACKWFVNDDDISVAANATKWGAVIGTTPASNYALTINKNISTTTGINIRAQYDYVDSVSLATLPVTQEVTVSVVENAGTVILASVTTPNGNIFQSIAGSTPDLPVQARMIRGGSDDITDVEYRWYVSIGGNYYEITSANAPAGSGLPSGSLFSWNQPTLIKSDILTVKSTAVLNTATIKCEIKDIDQASSTKNSTATGYASLIDLTDPYDIIIQQPKGDGINGSSGTVDARFEIWQKGTAMSDTFYNGKTLRFYRNTAAGATDTAWVPSPAFSGWTVAAGVVSKAFTAAATAANRTVVIANGHLLPTSAQTVFGVILEG